MDRMEFMDENMDTEFNIELDDELMQQAEHVATLLNDRKLMLAVAESCTAGVVSYVLTSVAGSSSWFDRGFVVYTNKSKSEMLGVAEELLVKYGAVSEQTALAMASGACANSYADLTVAITGIAGPDGGTDSNPVGTVWIAWHRKSDNHSYARKYNFAGDRQQIRLASCKSAIAGIESLL